MRLLLVTATPLFVTGCSSIADFVGNVNPPLVHLEVWNRTLDDATLTDRDGTLRPCLDHLDSQPGVFLDP